MRRYARVGGWGAPHGRNGSAPVLERLPVAGVIAKRQSRPPSPPVAIEDVQARLLEPRRDRQAPKHVGLDVGQHAIACAVSNRQMRDDLLEAAAVGRRVRPPLRNCGRELPQAIGRLGVEVEHAREPPGPPENHIENRQLRAQAAELVPHLVGQAVPAEKRIQRGDVRRHPLRRRAVEPLPPDRHQWLDGRDGHDDRGLAPLRRHPAILPSSRPDHAPIKHAMFVMGGAGLACGLGGPAWIMYAAIVPAVLCALPGMSRWERRQHPRWRTVEGRPTPPDR